MNYLLIRNLCIHTEAGTRGKGIGTIIINLGTEHIFEETNIKSVHGIIKQENIKSIKAFTKAGYTETSNEIIKGVDCIRMVKERGQVCHEQIRKDLELCIR